MSVAVTAINISFALFVLVAILGPLIWAIRPASHDHHTARRAVAVPNPERWLAIEQPLETAQPVIEALARA